MDVELFNKDNSNKNLEPDLNYKSNTDEFPSPNSSNISKPSSCDLNDHIERDTLEKISSQCGIENNDPLSDNSIVTESISHCNENLKDPPVVTSSENFGISNAEVSVCEIDISDDEKNGISEITSGTDVAEVEYNFKYVPFQITGSWKEFSFERNDFTRNNFTRGCKWAPDGSCILTCSDDNILRIFNLPSQLWDISQWNEISEMEAVLKVSEGELIYDYCWYPCMSSTDFSTCCLASASRNSPVHLWDAFTGELRCSYRTYNHVDEIVTPHSLSFDADGQKLFCGFEKVIRIFNVDTPGRNFEERQIYARKYGQSGIVSCFAFTPANPCISAVGTYQKTIGIYSEPNGVLECLLEGQKGGITQLQFSPDSMLLYSGGRKDPEIRCWDLRNPGHVLFSLRRSCVTNQRMYFDLTRCGKYVVSGNHNGVISIWDTTKEPKTISDSEFDVLEPIQFFLAHDDCVNGISLHPTFPLLCSSSGQRKFPSLLSEEDEEMFCKEIDKFDNSLRLWWVGKCS